MQLRKNRPQTTGPKQKYLPLPHRKLSGFSEERLMHFLNLFVVKYLGDKLHKLGFILLGFILIFTI